MTHVKILVGFYCNETNSYKVYLEEQYEQHLQDTGQKLKQKKTGKIYDSSDLEKKQRTERKKVLY